MRKASFLVSIALFLGGLALGGEATANWPAPATWSPARVQGALTTMGQVTDPLPFIGVAPCRILDTRGNGAPIQGGIFTGGSDVRSYFLAGICGIPTWARAVSLNFTVTGPGQTTPGFLTAWPTNGAVPTVSILNWDRPQQQIANAAVVPTNINTGITVNVSAPTHVIIDTNGFYAGAGAGSSNTFLGLNAGNFTMTGELNTAIGTNAFAANTTGFANTASGAAALISNTTGSSNTASGANALQNNTTGTFNTASGAAALVFNTGGSNTACGASALANNTTAFNNTASGAFALVSNTSGGGNTASGAQALQNNTTGFNNTADGTDALLNNTTGSDNIAIGNAAGSNLTTGNSNIEIGNLGVAGESATIRIGAPGFHTDTYIGGIFASISAGGSAVFANSAGKLGTNLSARRFKQDIREIGEASDGLMRLRPVTFQYKTEFDPKGLTQYGLIAEEVAEVYPELVAYDPDGKPLTVHYHLVNALLLSEVQKQRRTIEAQERKIEKQTETIEELEARMTRLETRITAEPLR